MDKKIPAWTSFIWQRGSRYGKTNCTDKYKEKEMKYFKQDSRVCIFYVTDKLLNEFKDEMMHNIGVDSLHNHFSKKWENIK